MNLNAPIYNLSGSAKGEILLPKDKFTGHFSSVALYQSIRAFLANQRVPGANTKTRGEVRGGGRKPWKQKGTGRARTSSTRNPIWVGGGITFGPRKIRTYKQRIPAATRQMALWMTLASKQKDKAILFVNSLELGPKTKSVVEFLNKLPINENTTILMLTAEHNPNLYRATKNLPYARTMTWKTLSSHDVLAHDYLILEEAVVEQMGGVKVSATSLPRQVKAGASKPAVKKTTKTTVAKAKKHLPRLTGIKAGEKKA